MLCHILLAAAQNSMFFSFLLSISLVYSCVHLVRFHFPLILLFRWCHLIPSLSLSPINTPCISVDRRERMDSCDYRIFLLFFLFVLFRTPFRSFFTQKIRRQTPIKELSFLPYLFFSSLSSL